MNTIFILIGIVFIAMLIIFLFKFYDLMRKNIWSFDEKLNIIKSSVFHVEKNIEKRLIDLETRQLETQNAIYLSQLDFELPVFMGGWSIDTFLGKYLVQFLINSKPKTIMELGSGSSTLLIAKTLQKIGSKSYTHIAVDHETKYLNITREYARLNNLDDKVIWLDCPLVNYQEYEKLWYGGVVEHLEGTKIDLLIIDGPPGPLQKNSRYPALPLLYPYLNDKCTILLDDAIREDEQYISRKWIEEFPEFNLVFELEGHGIAVLSR